MRKGANTGDMRVPTGKLQDLPGARSRDFYQSAADRSRCQLVPAGMEANMSGMEEAAP